MTGPELLGRIGGVLGMDRRSVRQVAVLALHQGVVDRGPLVRVSRGSGRRGGRGGLGRRSRGGRVRTVVVVALDVSEAEALSGQLGFAPSHACIPKEHVVLGLTDRLLLGTHAGTDDQRLCGAEGLRVLRTDVTAERCGLHQPRNEEDGARRHQHDREGRNDGVTDVGTHLGGLLRRCSRSRSSWYGASDAPTCRPARS